MAKVVEQIVLVKLSKLVKGTDEVSLVNDDLLAALEQVAEELSESGVIVEVEEAK